MKNIYFLCLVLAFSFLFITSCKGVGDKICFEAKCFNIEIVSKPDELMRGLQFRKELPENSGMLFVFSYNDRMSFWMKDTFIPLDMIWLDDLRKVVHIEKDVPTCKEDPCPSYSPTKAARYVLELNAGSADKHKIRIGDQAKFDVRR
ncbi:MAG: DUF192 domain-containing protein [Candidatus Omnitrophica bacterium]|nr:DUF192 domain-containing protein [Candidatus Omnitrophota bacterium]